MFNLNDPRWGRGDDSSSSGKPVVGDSSDKPEEQRPIRPQQSQQDGPPDLDEFWRDLNRKFAALLGKGGGSQPPTPGRNGPVWGMAGTIAGILLLLWLGTGFFIVQEGQQAVITQFGKYKSTVGAGVNWRLPYPIERHETVFVSQIRSLDIGRDSVLKATGLKESAMLTEDENILDIKFAVQYRLSDARAYLFESKNPSEAVVQAAETAVREVVGKMRMDAALSEERDQIAPRVRELMQKILDRYHVGVEVVGINLQQGGVRPPEQVQASFDDVLKAGQERERTKNEAEAYANDVIPRAVGTASRLKEEAQAYKARVVAQAEGDAQRFRSVLTEYQKAPQVLRDRMYLDTMQQIYSNVTKVIVDSRQNGNLLYLPLDKIMQSTSSVSVGSAVSNPASATSDTSASGAAGTASNSLGNDSRSRDSSRTRDRDPR
ncbi:FtsH protease activity modulator HflK [Curvibacter sp. CHRR-16]|nr:FtsH protease activity modulator HflK [Curvibacter sp. CHRR-16]